MLFEGVYPGTCRAFSRVQKGSSVPAPRVLTILDCVEAHGEPVHCWKFQPFSETKRSIPEYTGTSTPLEAPIAAALAKNWPDWVSEVANSPADENVSNWGSQ